MYFHLFLILSVSFLAHAQQKLTVIDAHTGLNTVLQENPHHTQINRIKELITALAEHKDSTPQGHIPDDFESEIQKILKASPQTSPVTPTISQPPLNDTIPSQITVAQAHEALISFAQANPAHPAMTRIFEIIASLKDHIEKNPTARFQKTIEDEIHALLGVSSIITSSIFKQIIPWLITGGILFMGYKFARSFITDAQVTQQMNVVSEQAQEVRHELEEVKPLVAELVAGDRMLTTKTQEALQLLISLYYEQILKWLGEHTSEIDQLHRDQREVHSLLQKILKTLGLRAEREPDCCIRVERARSR